MHHFAIVANLRFQDVVDILFLTVVVYHLYLWFWGTKAFKALVGLLVLGILFTVARFWGLFLTTWVFQVLWQVLVILIIILFQSEIRQVLERVNPLRVIGLHTFPKSADWIANFGKGVFFLGDRKIGALIIIERLDRVDELVTGGMPLEGEVSPELLMSVFQKESPLHDGALLVRRGRVAKVACYLPLSSTGGLPKEWSTRHRAALGLSERCDAWVVVVSEERGAISLARGGKMTHVTNVDQLSSLVQEAITPPRPAGTTWWERLRSLTIRRWPVKIGSLALISLVWLLLAGQQNFEVTLKVPLEVTNVPPEVEILEPVNPEVQVTVRGLRKDASPLTKRSVQAKIDVSMARFGNRVFPITRGQIVLSTDRVKVVDIEPSQMTFKFRKTESTD